MLRPTSLMDLDCHLPGLLRRESCPYIQPPPGETNAVLILHLARRTDALCISISSRRARSRLQMSMLLGSHRLRPRRTCYICTGRTCDAFQLPTLGRVMVCSDVCPGTERFHIPRQPYATCSRDDSSREPQDDSGPDPQYGKPSNCSGQWMAGL